MSEQKEQMYLPLDCFELEKVKITKDDISVKFIALEKTDKGTVKTPVDLNPPYQAHKDLIKVMNSLRTYLLRQYGYNKILDAVEADHKTKKVVAAWDELVDNTNVSGFSIFGKDTSKGCVITGSFKTDSGTMGVSSNRIVFSSSGQGYEAEVEKIIAKATKEVHACVFEGKRANQDLFSGSEETTKKKATKPKKALKKA